MARSNIVDSQFNPANLQPAGPPSRQPYGGSSGDLQQQWAVTTPMQGPDGRTYVKTEIQGTDGSQQGTIYTSKDPQTGQLTSYRNDAPSRPDGNGGRIQMGADKWTQGDFHKDQGFKTVFGDKKLMAFLAIAGAGAALSTAYGAGGAGGAAYGSGTGAPPGLFPGGTMGTEAIGTAATGAATTAPAWTGEGDTVPPGSDIPGGPPVTPPGTKPPVDPGWLAKLGIPPEVAKIIAGVVGGVGSNYISNEQQQKLRDEANKYAQTVTDASKQAADMSKFTPYNISGGLSTVGPDGKGGVTASLDPRLKAIQDQALGKAGGFFNSINPGTPEQLAQQSYANYNAWAKPAQEQQFSALQDRLARQGLIGLNVNTQSLPQTANSGPTMGVQGGNQADFAAGGRFDQSGAGPTLGVQGGTAADFAPGGKFGNGTQPSQTVGVNPYYKDFAQGVALADLKNYENSMRFGQEITKGQFDLGSGFLGVGTGLDKINQDYLGMSGKFGEAQMRAGQVGGSFLLNGARDAAQVALGQGQGEAKADAERNKAIWDAIFKNIF